MIYRIELTKAAVRDLTAVPKPMLKRLDACILGLANDPLPLGVKMLKNSNGLYRVRVSDYRILYRIEHEILTVLVVKIGHRREVYR
ncbi:MAG TPA: type II toxin-antitoxin system RelE/ParE family toxin [Geomonas sp.]